MTKKEIELKKIIKPFNFRIKCYICGKVEDILYKGQYNSQRGHLCKKHLKDRYKKNKTHWINKINNEIKSEE